VVFSELWYEFQPGQRVMTVEGVAGRVDEVVDGPRAGNETYLVTLDAGLGGGEYGSSELTPLAETTAAVETAASWYPELGTILEDRLPPADAVPASDYLAGRVAKTAADLLAEANADQDPTCPCGTPARLDPENGWQHADTSYSHTGDLSPYTVSDLMAEAGWVRDMLDTPTAEHSYDWCRFRRESHCFYPHDLNEPATKEAGYAVWNPVDRGRCPRGSWPLQEQCPVGQAGPNAGGFTDATVPWGEGGQHGGVVASAPTKARTYITQAEARGNSRPVSHEEFDRLSDQGKGLIDQMRASRAPITGLDQHWDALKRSTYDEARKPWGGATIDAHTGVPLESNADRYALSVKSPDVHSMSVHEDASRPEFEHAMDTARERFRPLLENGQHHLGVFHDDENHRIDMDPVVVVHTPDEVEKIGAHTHAIGGAYHFRTGDGYWPPHVTDEQPKHEGALGEQITWNGPGHWRSHAEAVQPGYVHPDDEGELHQGSVSSNLRVMSTTEPFAKNFQLHYEHAPSERSPHAISGKQSFASPDTAIGRARVAFDAGAKVVQVVRRHDGKVIYDPHAGIDVGPNEWYS
jgi:hypothetical protein